MRFRLEDCSPELKRRIEDAIRKQDAGNNVAVPIADLEPPARHEPLAEGKGTFFDSRVSIHVHSVRKRLTDSDGVSAKAAIDGLVHAKILHDDDPSHVGCVTYSQEKGKDELTIITIKTID